MPLSYCLRDVFCWVGKVPVSIFDVVSKDQPAAHLFNLGQFIYMRLTGRLTAAWASTCRSNFPVGLSGSIFSWLWKRAFPYSLPVSNPWPGDLGLSWRGDTQVCNGNEAQSAYVRPCRSFHSITGSKSKLQVWLSHRHCLSFSRTCSLLCSPLGHLWWLSWLRLCLVCSKCRFCQQGWNCSISIPSSFHLPCIPYSCDPDQLGKPVIIHKW